LPLLVNAAKEREKRKDRRKEIRGGEGGGHDKNMVLLCIFFYNSRVHAFTKVQLVKEFKTKNKYKITKIFK